MYFVTFNSGDGVEVGDTHMDTVDYIAKDLSKLIVRLKKDFKEDKSRSGTPFRVQTFADVHCMTSEQGKKFIGVVEHNWDNDGFTPTCYIYEMDREFDEDGIWKAW